jgi:hypothetical protein
MSDAQTPGGWPDAARPGVPMHPERDGWHWLRNRWGATVPALWLVSDGMWRFNDASYSAKNAGQNQKYLGPCHTPAEVAALVGAARREEREACASLSVRVEVPPGVETWSPLEAWEEALILFNNAFRAALRARGGA